MFEPRSSYGFYTYKKDIEFHELDLKKEYVSEMANMKVVIFSNVYYQEVFYEMPLDLKVIIFNYMKTNERQLIHWRRSKFIPTKREPRRFLRRLQAFYPSK